MSQAAAWEREYRDPLLMTKEADPQADTKKFFKYLEKEKLISFDTLKVIDIGCGTGRNANYLAELGAQVVGLDISPTAIDLGKQRAKELGVAVDYRVFDFGTAYPFADCEFDLALDVMSSNSLDEAEREIYLKETVRVLKDGGYFFVKALCKDGDKNAKNLLKISPGAEYDTYINTDMGLTERVFSREDFEKLYSQYFTILKLEKKTNYARFKGQNYKRNYWIAYLQK